MNIQNYLLCILYIFLLIIQTITLCQKDYHRGLISLFTFALATETVWTILVTFHQTFEQPGHDIRNLTLTLTSATSFQYNAQFIHILAINLFILFLLIVAKGWPITRNSMPFKSAFAIFWLSCLSADLTTFYWTTLSASLGSPLTNYSQNVNISSNADASKFENTTSATLPITKSSSQMQSNSSIDMSSEQSYDNFNSIPYKLSLLLRIIIMIYFLLELRTTMILEQEKRKLQFYLNFGALTMVWLVHTLIVYVISLRVDDTWRQELVSGCSSAANFIGFAFITKLLWHKNNRSQLFRKHSCSAEGTVGDYNADRCEIDNYSTVNQGEEDELDSSEEYGGLEMKNLRKTIPEEPPNDQTNHRLTLKTSP